MKNKSYIGDSGVTVNKDIVGPIVITTNCIIILGLTILAILAIINS